MSAQNQFFNDPQLLKEYQKGDRKAFEFLVKSYLQPIYNFVCRFVGGAHNAEDITQEVFVKVWKNAKRFDPSKSFKTWIFHIAKNASLDFLKKKKEIMFSEFEDTIADQSPLPQELATKVDASLNFNSMLGQLAPKHRMVLFLRYNDHFTFREIAESLGKPLHTVKSQHHRAIGMLKNLLKK